MRKYGRKYESLTYFVRVPEIDKNDEINEMKNKITLFNEQNGDFVGIK